MVETTGPHFKPFLGHAVAVLIAAIITLLSPIYVVSTSEGEVYSLNANGWIGNSMASYALNTTNTGDYPTVLWACVLAAAGGMVLLVTALVQKKVSTNLWGTLAALAWVPVIVPCLFLGADGFPMPAFSATIPDIVVTITAGWGGALWAQVVVASLALGGTILASHSPPAKTPAPAPQASFLDGPAFHKLQAELVIRQSYVEQRNEFPENSTK